MVNRTLNEWSEWQLKNLNAIVWLYRGEIDKYQALIKDYYAWIRMMPLPFGEMKVSEELAEKMQNVGTLDEYQPIKDFLSQERENAQNGIRSCWRTLLAGTKSASMKRWQAIWSISTIAKKS